MDFVFILILLGLVVFGAMSLPTALGTLGMYVVIFGFVLPLVVFAIAALISTGTRK